MNIQDDIVSFLEYSGYDDFTKIRYIYLYVCDLFSYDIRFLFGTQDLKKDIYYKKLDIQNVTDFEITCYTYAKILVDLLSLFNINAEIVRENNYGFRHSYVVVRHQGKVIKLDPTEKHDTTRVKMHVSTLGYKSLIPDTTFSDQLQEADQQIKDETKYRTDYDKNDAFMRSFDFLMEQVHKNHFSLEETFMEKFNIIVELVNARVEFKRYDDIDFYFGFLIKKFKMNEGKACVKPAVFFRRGDSEMKDLINLVLVEYNSLPPFFYILEREGDHFQLRPIDIKEVQEKLKEYTNWSVEYYFQNAVNRMLGKSIS